MICRGVRGATTVASDTAEDILAGAGELLMAMIQANSIIVDDLASIWFTTTPDLVSVFPSRAARELGWDHVAMLNAQEIPVVGSLSRCIRVLMHWNTSKQAKEIVHVYLHDAVNLRPDVARTSSP